MNSRLYYPPCPRFPATSRIVRDPNLINPSDIRHVGSAPFRKRSENPLFFFQDFPPSKRFTVVMFWRSDVSRPFFSPVTNGWRTSFFGSKNAGALKITPKPSICDVFFAAKKLFFCGILTQVVYMSFTKSPPQKTIEKDHSLPITIYSQIIGFFPLESQS